MKLFELYPESFESKRKAGRWWGVESEWIERRRREYVVAVAGHDGDANGGAAEYGHGCYLDKHHYYPDKPTAFEIAARLMRGYKAHGDEASNRTGKRGKKAVPQIAQDWQRQCARHGVFRWHLPEAADWELFKCTFVLEIELYLQLVAKASRGAKDDALDGANCDLACILAVVLRADHAENKVDLCNERVVSLLTAGTVAYIKNQEANKEARQVAKALGKKPSTSGFNSPKLKTALLEKVGAVLHMHKSMFTAEFDSMYAEHLATIQTAAGMTLEFKDADIELIVATVVNETIALRDAERDAFPACVLEHIDAAVATGAIAAIRGSSAGERADMFNAAGEIGYLPMVKSNKVRTQKKRVFGTCSIVVVFVATICRLGYHHTRTCVQCHSMQIEMLDGCSLRSARGELESSISYHPTLPMTSIARIARRGLASTLML